MVKIKRGDVVLIVSAAAFETQYKPFGYVLADSKAETTKAVETQAPAKPEKVKAEKAASPAPVAAAVEPTKVEVPEELDESEEQDGDEDFEGDSEHDEPEKPLSEMDGEELQAKAKQLGIDVSKCTKRKEVRALIRKYIEAHS